MKGSLVFLSIFFFASGCMVGPNYQQPEVSMPVQFEQVQTQEGATADLSEWWKQFNDPLLDELITEALHANYNLLIAIEKIEETRAQYRIEKSYLWPEIDLNAAGSRTRISQNLFKREGAEVPGQTSTPFPPYLDVFQVGFDAIWEFDLFGKYRRSRNAAQYTLEATQEEAQSVLISMLSEVAVSYVNIRAIQKKIELTKQLIQVDEEQLAIRESLLEIGLNNEIQNTTQISTLQTDRASLPILESSFKQTVYSLAYLLGRQPEGLLDLFQEIRPIPSSNDRVPVGLPSDLLRRRPDVRSAERQLAAANEQIGAAVADLFPRIALTGISFGGGNREGSSVGFEGYSLRKLLTWPSRVFSVGLGLNWNLLDFGRVRGQIDVQNSLQRQALLNYEQTVISSLKDVESALVAYFEEQKRQDSLQIKVAADRRTMEITQSLHTIGLANHLQVLDTLKNLLNSENALVESEQALTGDLIALYKAIGGNWVID